MSRRLPESPEDALRQAGQHLASLRAAGLEFVPTAPLPELPAAMNPGPAQVVLSDEQEQRRVALTVLAEQVAGCTRCPELVATRSRTVFGVGPLDAELCFVGEAPGADEDRQGEPFVGAAGQLLNRIIAACGLKREEVYICNVLRCRPPSNRAPQPQEADNCREYLVKTLELVKPRVMCVLGNSPAKFLMGVSQGITKLRGKWLEYRGIPVMPTFHPSYLLRTPEAKKEVWEDMKEILRRLGRSIPGAKA